jgi:hypothetical protein
MGCKSNSARAQRNNIVSRSISETAAYIGPKCLELRNLALEADLKLLAHLLEMASLEAVNIEVAQMKARRQKLCLLK